MHSSENIFPSVQLLSVSDPHQELCHWTQASMHSSMLGWRNLSVLLCVLCMPVQTVINLPVHRGRTGALKYQTSVFIKQQSDTAYRSNCAVCMKSWKFTKTDNATSSSRLGLLSTCTTVYSYFNVMHWKSATQQNTTKQFLSKQNMHYNT